MTNPYKPPESKLVSQEEAQKYRPLVGWKIYLWLSILISLLMLLSIGLSFTESRVFLDLQADYTLLDGFDFSLWVLSLLGVYGMAWTKKVFSHRFWQILFFIFLFWVFFYSIVYPFYFGFPTYGTHPDIENLMFEVPLSFIHFYPLYRYVFSMEYLWENKSKDG
ncbi:MAG: hypothetical protein V3U71_02230 [Cocleimonas sp.]